MGECRTDVFVRDTLKIVTHIQADYHCAALETLGLHDAQLVEIVDRIGGYFRYIEDLETLASQSVGKGAPLPHTLAEKEGIAEQHDIIDNRGIKIGAAKAVIVVTIGHVVIHRHMSLYGVRRHRVTGNSLDEVKPQQPLGKIQPERQNNQQDGDVLEMFAHGHYIAG